jgi:hypothetical protein
LAGVGLAQIDPNPDGIGFYFDQAATTFARNTSEPFELVTGYLCATRTTEPSGIVGWRATFELPDGIVTPDVKLPYRANMSWTDGCVVVTGIDPPLPPDPVVVLMKIDFTVPAVGQPVCFYIDGCPGNPLFEHNPTYQAAVGAGGERPLRQLFGSHTQPIGIINDCGQPVELQTWGAVKALYD